MPDRRRRALVVPLLVCLALLAGCNGTPSTPSADKPPSASASAVKPHPHKRHPAAQHTPRSQPPPSAKPRHVVAAKPHPGASVDTVTKVLLFVMENHSLSQMEQDMPRTFALAQRFGYADNYYALSHPSLPNYVAWASGDMHGVNNDDPPSGWRLSGPTIFGRAIQAGKTAGVYADSMPSPCYQQDAGDYAVRHNPWTYFVDERGLCERFDQPIGGLDAAITGGQLPNMGYVAPNMCHDAHDCPLSQADAWFAAEMQKVFNGPDWVSGHLAVVLTADEDAHNEGNKVLTVVIHPSQSHDVVHQRFDHYSLYALFEDVLGLPHLHPGAAAPSLANAFGLPLAH